MIRAVALVLGLAFQVSAQQPNLQQKAYRDFSGGYVDNVDPVNLKDNESPDLLNVLVDDPVGSLKPRRGIVRCGNVPSGNAPTNLYEYTRSDGTRRLIVTDNLNVYSTPDCQSWTTIGGASNGFTASDQVYFATVRDTLWIVNGSTWPHTWDGTTLVLLDGRANTPNPAPPKCAFVEFWKERVWCGAPSGDPSGVAYSALTDSNGNDLNPSTGTLAWPAINVFEIDQNAGSRVYGIKAYRNRLYAFKDNGVWEIGFDNDFNNFVRKTYASVGSRFQTSIVEVDGVLYFVGRDGIYAFDGQDAVRVSRRIENKFRTLNQPLISQNYRLWTAASDFNLGTFSSATAADVSGSVTLSSRPAIVENGGFESGALSPFRATTSGSDTSDAAAEIITGAAVPLQTYAARAVARGVGGTHACGFDATASATIYLFDVNGSTLTSAATSPSNTVSTYTLDTSAWSGRPVFLHWVGGVSCSGHSAYGDIYSSSFTARSYVTFMQSGCLDVPNATCQTFSQTYGWGFSSIDNVQAFQYESSGTWISEIYNTVSVSTWGAFTANATENGGAIAYSIRYAATSGGVNAASYSPIVPGAIIPAPITSTFIQVRAVLTAPTNQDDTPKIDDVQIAWNSGGNNTQKIYSAQWKNSLWVSASSGTATKNNIVLNHARAPLDAWTLWDLNLGPMANFNDQFYVGASTHSAIYRADYGTNDDGAAIQWHWSSKDENYGLPNNAKYLSEIDADYRNDASCNIRIGYVQDQNTTYCVGNAPAPNASLASGVGSRRLNMNGGPAYTDRFKVCDDQKDQAPTILGITGWTRAIPRRGD